MNKKSIMLLYVSLGIILASCVFLFSFLFKNHYSKVENVEIAYNVENIEKNTIQASTKQEKKVKPSTKIRMTQYYQRCGHTVRDMYKVPSAIINMNEDEIKKYYNGWELTNFSEDEISLYKVNDAVCNEHFILKDINGYVNVLVQTKNGDESLYKATDIMTKYLSEEDRESLKNGIKVVGREDLASILQDFQ